MFQLYILPIVISLAISLFLGYMLMVVAKFMAVPVDERVAAVMEVLPGANCGACGYAGCEEYANRLVEGVAPITACTAGGAGVVEGLAKVMGQDAVDVVPVVAVVNCSGNNDVALRSFNYIGRGGCEAVSLLYNGDLACKHGCLGYGDCLDVCKFDALTIENGLAVVDRDNCTGCGMCVDICPHQVISLKPTASHVNIACSSTDKGAVTRKICSLGCIGCKKCEKACPTNAITTVNNLAAIDPALCTNCGECIATCPNNTIVDYLQELFPAEEAPLAAEA